MKKSELVSRIDSLLRTRKVYDAAICVEELCLCARETDPYISPIRSIMGQIRELDCESQSPSSDFDTRWMAVNTKLHDAAALIRAIPETHSFLTNSYRLNIHRELPYAYETLKPLQIQAYYRYVKDSPAYVAMRRPASRSFASRFSFFRKRHFDKRSSVFAFQMPDLKIPSPFHALGLMRAQAVRCAKGAAFSLRNSWTSGRAVVLRASNFVTKSARFGANFSAKAVAALGRSVSAVKDGLKVSAVEKGRAAQTVFSSSALLVRSRMRGLVSDGQRASKVVVSAPARYVAGCANAASRAGRFVKANMIQPVVSSASAARAQFVPAVAKASRYIAYTLIVAAFIGSAYFFVPSINYTAVFVPSVTGAFDLALDQRIEQVESRLLAVNSSLSFESIETKRELLMLRNRMMDVKMRLNYGIYHNADNDRYVVALD